MKGLKQLSHKLLKSQKDTLSKRFLNNDIRDISLREWDDMHKGNLKSFVKKVWRFLFKIITTILKSKVQTKLDELYNQAFERFGVPLSHIEKANSLRKELKLRCDSIIKKDKTLETLANIEKETRETIESKQSKGDTFQNVLSSINLEKGTRYNMNDTSVEEFYSIMKKLNDA